MKVAKRFYQYRDHFEAFSIITPNFSTFFSEEKAALEDLSKRRDIIVKVANKDGAWLFCGPTSTKKKLCYNFLTLLFMPKSIKISLPLTNKLSRALLMTL